MHSVAILAGIVSQLGRGRRGAHACTALEDALAELTRKHGWPIALLMFERLESLGNLGAGRKKRDQQAATAAAGSTAAASSASEVQPAPSHADTARLSGDAACTAQCSAAGDGVEAENAAEQDQVDEQLTYAMLHEADVAAALQTEEAAAAEAAGACGEADSGAQVQVNAPVAGAPRGLAQLLPPQRKQARNQPSSVARDAASTVLLLQLLFGSTLTALQAIYKQGLQARLSTLPSERIPYSGRASSSRKSNDARAALVSLAYLVEFMEPGLRSKSVVTDGELQVTNPAQNALNAAKCLSTMAELITQKLWLKLGWLLGMDIAEQAPAQIGYLALEVFVAKLSDMVENDSARPDMLAMYIDARATENLWGPIGAIDFGDEVQIEENDPALALLQQRARAQYGLQSMDLLALCSDTRLVQPRGENRSMLHHGAGAPAQAGPKRHAHATEHRLRDVLELCAAHDPASCKQVARASQRCTSNRPYHARWAESTLFQHIEAAGSCAVHNAAGASARSARKGAGHVRANAAWKAHARPPQQEVPADERRQHWHWVGIRLYQE